MPEIRLLSAFGCFDLYRYPRRKREQLRAWDAADEYLLRLVAEDRAVSGQPLICNDQFGALTVSLHLFQPLSWSDSWLAHHATGKNLQANGLPPGDVTPVQSLQLPPPGLRLALIKVPKNLALLQYQLIRLRPLLDVECRLLVGGLQRSMPSSLWKMLEQLVGPTTTHPGWKTRGNWKREQQGTAS